MEGADFAQDVVLTDLENTPTSREIDEFHPIPHILQTILSEVDGINYIGEVDPLNMFLTNGVIDTRIIYNSSEALGTALAHAGYVRSAGADAAKNLEDSFGIEYIVGASDSKYRTPFPTTGNLDNGGTGLFSFNEGGHWGWQNCGVVGEFLYTASRGGPAVLADACPIDTNPATTNPPPFQLP